MRTILLLVVSLAISANLLAQTPAKRPMSVDDELRLRQIQQALISPDGKHFFYTVSELNWEENDHQDRHYMGSTDGEEVFEYIGPAGGEEFQFSPDGNYLTFFREVSEGQTPSGEEKISRQIFIMPTGGGEAIQLTEHRGEIIAHLWFEDESGLVFLAEEVGSEEQEAERELGADEIYVDEAPNGKDNARFTNFWHIDLATQTERRISSEKLVVEGFDLSPDKKKIAFTARPDTRTNYVGEAELYLATISNGQVQRLTNNSAPESAPLWSPDGRLLAYRAPSDKTFELRAGYFWIMNLDSGERKQLDGQSTGELYGGDIAWAPNSRHIYYNEIHGTNTNLYRIDVRNGKAEALTRHKGTLRVQSLSKDFKRMLYTYENFTTPPDLYLSDIRGRRAIQLTELNPWVNEELQLAEAELLRWRSKGDMEIEGAFYPALGNGKGKVPLILNIHGGPAGVIENAFRSDLQILAGQGYAVLGPNFRGSTGYGDELLRGLIGEVGDGEFVDLMTGVDYTIKHRNVDPEKLGVRGWSWGGVSSSYVITQTQRFKAASIGAMVGNWAAETGPGFNFDVSLWYIGGTPWDNPEEWRKRSSISHVKNVTTPSIIFHGGQDTTSSVGQSLMFFTALRDIGKAPVRYIKFPRAGHGIGEPRHRRALGIAEMAWFKRYIEGEEWTLPPFKE